MFGMLENHMVLEEIDYNEYRREEEIEEASERLDDLECELDNENKALDEMYERLDDLEIEYESKKNLEGSDEILGMIKKLDVEIDDREADIEAIKEEMLDIIDEYNFIGWDI